MSGPPATSFDRRGFLTTLTGSAAAAAGLAFLPAGTASAGEGVTTLDVLSDVQGDLADLSHALNHLDSLGTADALVVNGDLVAITVRLVGQRRGRRVDLDGVHLVRIAGGEIVEGWSFCAEQAALDAFFSA